MRLRLSLFWFFYMAGLGIFFPFYSLYLSRDLALSGSQVGLVMGTLPLIGLFAQPLWGQIADRTGSRRRVLALLCLGIATTHLGLGFLRGFVAIAAGTALLALFSVAALPMATAVSLAAIRERGSSAFGPIRMWGTIGFLTLVVSFPALVEALRSSSLAQLSPWRGLSLMFPLIASFSLAAALVALRLPRSHALDLPAERGVGRGLLRHAPVFRLLIVVFAAHFFTQGPIVLFPLYITARGGDAATIGKMWIFMLLLEIPLVGFLGSALRRIGPRGLLLAGLISEGIRWSLCALATDLTWIYVVQLLHGIGVVGLLIGAALYLEESVPEGLRSTGQAVISAAGLGGGAILSNAAAGWLFEHAGPSVPYAVAGGGALLLAMLLLRWLPPPFRPASSRPAIAPLPGKAEACRPAMLERRRPRGGKSSRPLEKICKRGTTVSRGSSELARHDLANSLMCKTDPCQMLWIRGPHGDLGVKNPTQIWAPKLRSFLFDSQ